MMRVLRLGTGGLLGVLCFVSPAGATQTGADFLSAIQGVQVPDTPVSGSGSDRDVKGARPTSPVGQPEPVSTHPLLPRQACTSSVALSQVRARLMAERAAGQRAAAAADTRLATAKKREADLQGTVATLQARITALQSQQTPDAAAKTAAQSARVQQVTAELARVKTQLQQRVADQASSARLWQHAMSALQGQLAAVTTDNRQRADEKVQLTQAQATVQSLTEKLQHTQAQLAALTRQQAAQHDKAQQAQTQTQKTLSDQNAALQAQLTAATQQRDALSAKVASLTDASSSQKTLSDQNAALQAQLTAATQQRDALSAKVASLTDASSAQKTLSDQNAALQAQLTAATQQRDALSAKVASLTDASSAQKTLSDQNAALQAQLTAATQQRDALSAQVASLTQSQATEHQALLAVQAKPATPVVPPTTPAVSLTDARSQQTYASGVMMAGTLRRTLALQKDLGVSSDPVVLLAGVTDGVQGTLKLDRKVLNAQYAAIIQRLSDKEKGRFDAGIKRLEAVTAKKTVRKRNGSLFFVQTRKGAQAVKTGETLQLSVRESLLDGKVLRDDRSRSVTLNEQLPYMLQQAVLLGGRGGVVEVYCFASDIYPPERLPDGLFSYSLMKYTVSIGAQA